MADVPYQNASQVEQALAERENAVAYGQKTLIEAADKVLASFGITSKQDRADAAKNRRAAAEESEGEPRKAEPAGRSTAKKSTAKKS
jgi:hypothetical protein